ncbi:hypothetical protein [Halostella litorea]|uniref:hypothetical protein n=1 Tax=Halostella litorea TaxID=2528831 RepID=UPI0010930CD3|nr:hypothetical protein [Halostella litorea]
MRLTKIAAIGLAALLLATGAAAAMPGNAPDHAQPANETTNESAQAGPPADVPADDADRGPPVDMPEQVPDHVSAIHEEINAFLDGTVDDLGDAVSDLTPADGDGSADDASADETADADSAENADESAGDADADAEQ